MSKEITIIKCYDCGRVIYRNEQGDINSENGIKGTITRIITANSSTCPYCQEVKHEKSKMGY